MPTDADDLESGFAQKTWLISVQRGRNEGKTIANAQAPLRNNWRQSLQSFITSLPAGRFSFWNGREAKTVGNRATVP